MSWYVSRALRVDHDTYFVVEGTDPWNRRALDAGPIGEHARWWLKLRLKHERVPWNPLRDPFPRVTGTRLIHVTWVDRALARLLVVWMMWRFAR